ncbi:MAG: hypothetical protein JWM69_813 [Candidatus Binatus sp.]|nr:hypothetical protein [Candidatus Binatus sp.]
MAAKISDREEKTPKSEASDAPRSKRPPILAAPDAREHFKAVDALVLIAIVMLAFFLMARGGSRRGAELMPWPDGLEYAAAARNIDHGLGPVLHFGGYSYPSRYTEGYPLILAAAWPLVGGNPAHLYLATIAIGVLAIIAMYLLTLRMFGRLSAAFSTLILALSPVVLTYSTLVLSDVPTLAVTLLAALALVRATGSERSTLERASMRSAWAIFGFALGFSVMMRPTNAATLIGIGLCLYMVPPAGAGLRLRDLIAAGIAFLIGFAVPLIWQLRQNVINLGGAFASGYQWWVPEVYGKFGHSFSAKYLFGATLPRNPYGNLAIYLPTLFGLDGMMLGRGGSRFVLYPFAAAAFAAIGIVAAMRHPSRRIGRRITWFGVGFLSATFAIYSIYLFTDIAFLLPAAFVLFAAAGFGIVTANGWMRRVLSNRDRDSRSIAAAIGVIALDLLLAISLLSEVAGRLGPTPVGSEMVRALQEVDSKIPPDAAIVSNISLQFLELNIAANQRKFVGLNSVDPGETFTDYHLHRLFEKRAQGWKGPIPPVEFDVAASSPNPNDPVAAAIASQTPVFVLLAVPESAQYANLLKNELDQLQSKYGFDVIEQNSAIALYRLKPRVSPTAARHGKSGNRR